MKQTTQIHETAHLRELAAALIGQAVRDLINKRKPFVTRLNAFLFLTSPDNEIWSDITGASLSPYKLLPHLSVAKKKLLRRLT